jgi:hypothetical protein
MEIIYPDIEASNKKQIKNTRINTKRPVSSVG